MVESDINPWPSRSEFPLPATTRPHRRARLRTLRWVALTLALAATASCRDSFAGFGAGTRARTSADQLFGALVERHADIVRNPKYEYARVQLTRGALSPSHIFDDSAAWTGVSGPVRLLETVGSSVDGSYHMSSRVSVPAPTRPGDGRHVTTLSRLSDSEFRWETSVDFALGAVRPAEVGAVITRLIAGAEGRTEAQARADLLATAPRTSAALGSAFSLDSLHPVTLADGSTVVTLGISVHSDQLKRRYPAFSDFVHKYVDPARYRVSLNDRSGASYLEAQARDRMLTIRVRTLHGQLVALNGPARAMPDTLLLTADFTAKVKIFTVGFHNLQMEFVNEARGDREREWSVTARKEPEWNLPMISARLIRAPLRRPFAGEGALFRIGVRKGDGEAPTVLFRQSRLTVQESAILRFINSLSNTAMDDFGGRVEKEENQWLRDVFSAMRDDARGVLGP